MQTICVLVGALLLAGSCSAYYKPRITFSFVVDVTGSMSREINFVRQAIYNATYHLSHFRSLGIDHFILATFSDPLYLNRVYEYSSLHSLHNGTSVMKATGGGDCPEYGFDGLLKAINKSFANSYIFYFSDASAKDSYKESQVINAAKAKNIRIWIITTGCCTGNCSTNTPYNNVANRTGGIHYSVKENDLPVIMQYVNRNVRCLSLNMLKYPQRTFPQLQNWLWKYRDCGYGTTGRPWTRPPYYTRTPYIPPVGGVSTLSVGLPSVIMAVSAALIAF